MHKAKSNMAVGYNACGLFQCKNEFSVLSVRGATAQKLHPL